MSLPNDLSLSLLNIGTAVLVRDVMDQHLRSMGDIRTHYASNLNFALQTYSEKHLDMVFCELTFPGGSAEEFIRRIGGLDTTDNVYFVISTSQDVAHARALASELGVDSILPAPFSTNDIIDRVAQALKKKERNRTHWIDQLLEAKLSAKNMRVQEARAQFKELLKNHPTNEDILLEAAKFYIQLPDYDLAAQTIAAAIAANPQSIRARSMFGTLSIRKGDFDDGLKLLEEAQSQSPFNTGRMLEIGAAYVQMALRQCRRALDLNDCSTPAIVTSVKCQTMLGRYKDAIATYERFKDRLYGDERRECEYYVVISKKLGNIA